MCPFNGCELHRIYEYVYRLQSVRIEESYTVPLGFTDWIKQPIILIATGPFYADYDYVEGLCVWKNVFATTTAFLCEHLDITEFE